MIEKRCFRGLGLRGWVDEYRLEASGADSAAVAAKIIDFYVQRGAQLDHRDEELVFVRGRRIWTYLNPGPATWPRQTIRVLLASLPDGFVVSVRYDVACTLVLRFPPFGLEHEIESLSHYLNS